MLLCLAETDEVRLIATLCVSHVHDDAIKPSEQVDPPLAMSFTRIFPTDDGAIVALLRSTGGRRKERPAPFTPPDEALISQADLEGRVLVSKDDDFVQSRLVRGRPRMLWLVATGNVDNRALEAWVRHAIPQVERAFDSGGFVERGRDRLNFRA
jgi:predicted nuclease of predicted toxin-antitoxin system